jgi:hypothetical protein
MSMGENEAVVSKTRNCGSLIGASLVCLCLLGVSSCIYTAWTRAQDRVRRHECKSKLNAIGLALHNYHDRFGVFPPAVMLDGEGNAVHSWRALILPFLEEQAMLEKSSSYDFNVAWDSEANRPATDTMPSGDRGLFRCWKDPALEISHTSFVVITGKGTVWSVDEATSFKDISRPDDTVVAIEIAETGIPWAEPRDLAIDADFSAIVPSHGRYDDDPTLNVLMANGAVRGVLLSRFKSPEFRTYFLKKMPQETPPLE